MTELNPDRFRENSRVERTYKKALNSLPVGVALIDRRHGVLYANASMAENFGLSAEKRLKNPLWGVIEVSDRTFVSERYNIQKVFELECEFDKNWYRFLGVNVGGGQVNEPTIITVEDVTKQARAESSTGHEAGNLLNRLSWVGLISSSLEEVRRRREPNGPVFRDVEAYAKRQNDSFTFLKMLHEGMRSHPLHLRTGMVAVPPEEAAKGVKYLLTTEGGQLSARVRYQALFEMLPYGLGLMDNGGRLTAVNEQMRQLFDRSSEELIGFPIVSLLSQGESGEEELNISWFEEMKRGNRNVYQKDIFYNGWKDFRVVKGAGLGRDPFVIIGKDTSEQAMAIDNFASAIFREVNSIGEAIANLLIAMQAAEGTGEVSADELAKPRSYVNRLRGEIEGILIGLRGEFEYPLNPERIKKSPVNMSTLLSRIVKSYEGMSVENGIQLEGNIPADLPTIPGDRSQLSKAFGNLLKNALEATTERVGQLVRRQGFVPEGEDKVSVRAVIPAQEEEAYNFVEIIIEDTGVGIPEEIRDVVTKKYGISTKAHKSAAERGIGLYDTWKIIEGHSIEIGGQKIPASLHFYTLTEKEIKRIGEEKTKAVATGRKGPGTLAIVRVPFRIKNSASF